MLTLGDVLGSDAGWFNTYLLSAAFSFAAAWVIIRPSDWRNNKSTICMMVFISMQPVINTILSIVLLAGACLIALFLFVWVPLHKRAESMLLCWLTK